MRELLDRASKLTLEELQGVNYVSLVLPLKRVLPATIGSRLRSVPVALLPAWTPGAWTIRAPSGEPIVIWHTELGAVLSYYAEFIVIGQHFRGDPRLAGIAETVADWVWRVFQGRATKAYEPFPVDLPGEKMRLVRAATFAMEAFILLHEFAHITLGHVDHAGTDSVEGFANSGKLARVGWRRNDELEADRTAMEWICGIPEDNGDYNLDFLHLNKHAALEVFELFNLGLSENPHARNDGEHPPALDRLGYVVETCARFLDGEVLTYANRMARNMIMIESSGRRRRWGLSERDKE